MRIDRKIADVMYRNSFGAFVYASFEALYPGRRLMPNWHIDAICYAIELMVMGKSRNRFILNLLPRSLKSFIVSVCLPAWLLGRNPAARIICASYSQNLANKFSRECRALLDTPFYKRVFPGTLLNPNKITEGEFETTQGGYRLATSVGGTLTGRGGDILIIDDPIKADDANSQVALEGANEWFRNTALSRLDSISDSLVIVTMQRLHQNDLSGVLIEQGWPCLAIPAIATEPVDYLVAQDEIYHRSTGEVLQANRVSLEALEEIKGQVGSRIFEAQYQQNPTPAEGNLIKREWLKSYDIAPTRSPGAQVVQSWDVASTTTDSAAWSVCTTWLVIKRDYYLLDNWRGRLEFPFLKQKLIALADEHSPNRILIEQPGPGLNLLQELRANPVRGVPVPIGIKPDGDKNMRMEAQAARFEAGQVHLPKDAPWLSEFLHEILAFPNSRYSDQIDSVSQFLNWAETDRLRHQTVAIVGPRYFTNGKWYGSEWMLQE